jgi:pyrimidine operon attenuation protein/uracil phosphoribosyltransferase
VLVDRGGRELPIHADYVVRSAEVAENERVDVLEDSAGLHAFIVPSTFPSGAPGPA